MSDRRRLAPELRFRIRTKDGGYYWQCNRCDNRGTLRESIQAAQYAYLAEHGRRQCILTKPPTVTIGKATFTLVVPDRGWGGRYGQDRRPARWKCDDCGRLIDGTDDAPYPARATACINNGHAPCNRCGKPLPRLNCGCRREHIWTQCPGKTQADKLTAPKHGPHVNREEVSA